MSLAIAWTDEAQETFADTVSQIENKWGARSAEKFVQHVYKTIGIIANQPYMFICIH